jgi:hypothetical protein
MHEVDDFVWHRHICGTSMLAKLYHVVLRIQIRSRIRRIRMFLGLLDPDPFARCTDLAPDLDPSIIKQNFLLFFDLLRLFIFEK